MDNEVRKLGELAFAESEKKRKVFDGFFMRSNTSYESATEVLWDHNFKKKSFFMSFYDSKFPRVQAT